MRTTHGLVAVVLYKDLLVVPLPNALPAHTAGVAQSRVVRHKDGPILDRCEGLEAEALQAGVEHLQGGATVGGGNFIINISSSG